MNKRTAVIVVCLALLGVALPARAADPTGGAAPTACPPEGTDPARTMSGPVAETMDAAGYTYVRLAIGAEGTWAAIPKTTVTVGQCLVVRKPQRMVDFRSSSLARTFPEIYFGTLGQTSDAALVAAAHATTAGHAPTPPSSPPPVSVPRAEGPDGRTVAEVLGQPAGLAGKVVAVRGQVVKRSDGVMGKTWLHLVDGTGSADTGGTSLIVTTHATPEVGTVVTARGTVRVDLDLGYGYRYAVLLEDATVGP